MTFASSGEDWRDAGGALKGEESAFSVGSP
jgi:hypothetical protein